MPVATLPHTIALASDHAGRALRLRLADALLADGHRVQDLGPHEAGAVDYPDYGYRLADALAAGQAAFGIAVCGSGIGISIALNRHPAVRCALVSDNLAARLAREHNDANALALGARLIGEETALDCVRVFVATPFAGGRHAQRVAQLVRPHFLQEPA